MSTKQQNKTVYQPISAKNVEWADGALLDVSNGAKRLTDPKLVEIFGAASLGGCVTKALGDVISEMGPTGKLFVPLLAALMCGAGESISIKVGSGKMNLCGVLQECADSVLRSGVLNSSEGISATGSAIHMLGRQPEPRVLERSHQAWPRQRHQRQLPADKQPADEQPAQPPAEPAQPADEPAQPPADERPAQPAQPPAEPAQPADERPAQPADERPADERPAQPPAEQPPAEQHADEPEKLAEQHADEPEKPADEHKADEPAQPADEHKADEPAQPAMKPIWPMPGPKYDKTKRKQPVRAPAQTPVKPPANPAEDEKIDDGFTKVPDKFTRLEDLAAEYAKLKSRRNPYKTNAKLETSIKDIHARLISAMKRIESRWPEDQTILLGNGSRMKPGDPDFAELIIEHCQTCFKWTANPPHTKSFQAAAPIHPIQLIKWIQGLKTDEVNWITLENTCFANFLPNDMPVLPSRTCVPGFVDRPARIFDKGKFIKGSLIFRPGLVDYHFIEWGAPSEASSRSELNKPTEAYLIRGTVAFFIPVGKKFEDALFLEIDEQAAIAAGEQAVALNPGERALVSAAIDQANTKVVSFGRALKLLIHETFSQSLVTFSHTSKDEGRDVIHFNVLGPDFVPMPKPKRPRGLN